MTEQTLAIIKPDAVKAGNIGNILAMYEANNLKIVAMRMTQMSLDHAKQFYYVHHERPFYNSLIEFMISGQIVALVLQGENAVARNRELMGATNPAEAAPNTIRKQYASSIESNAVHGSDAVETAKEEIAFFFKPEEMHAE